ncbi:MAG TPA: hypothetical protein VNT01_14965 [Symbiobacteriaceae bacterium]|nr:hypothetical protein [Symbiobacteriaceae bacterium]
MNMGMTLTFDLPQGWTLRKVATALAREWLPPFRAIPAAKRAPWMVQPIVEESGPAGTPLWEPGISTEDYEERLERADLSWAIRAKAGRGNGTILARLAMSEQQPMAFQLVCSQDTFPESLFDAGKMSEFLEGRSAPAADSLFPTLLMENGFQLATA